MYGILNARDLFCPKLISFGFGHIFNLSSGSVLTKSSEVLSCQDKQSYSPVPNLSVLGTIDIIKLSAQRTQNNEMMPHLSYLEKCEKSAKIKRLNTESVNKYKLSVFSPKVLAILRNKKT
jgi:hypothetical protein